MEKEEFARRMSENDGLDRGGNIRSAADEDGNVFIFSENKYGCPVIDVLVEGKDKETLYYMAQPGRARIDERTGRVYEPEDPEQSGKYGRLFSHVSIIEKSADDLMALKIAKGSKVVDEGFVGGFGSLTKPNASRRARWRNVMTFPSARKNMSTPVCSKKRSMPITIRNVSPAMSSSSNKTGNRRQPSKKTPRATGVD